MHTPDVLVIDDNDCDSELTLFAVRRVAPRLRTYRLKDGVQAVHYLSRTGPFRTRAVGMPRLVLLDVEMPGLSGLDVLEVLFDAPITCPPIAMFTACENPLAMQMAKERGAHDYVIKPATLTAFCVQIDRLLNDVSFPMPTRPLPPTSVGVELHRH